MRSRITLRSFVFALATLPLSAGLSSAIAKPVVEIAFVLDTTGSMGGLIEGAKRKIWSIATAIVDSNPDADIRMGLIAYRDIGDEYVTKKVELTRDIQDLYANLLELKARGGGDWPESVNEALDVAVNKMQWTQGRDSTRIVFLVGDAPPHMDYAQDTKYPVTLAVAKQRDIIVNAVLAGNAQDTERVWRDIAQHGNGEFIPIPQDGGQIVTIETPFDEDIIILQREINGTVIPYGPRALQKRTESKTQQLASVAAVSPARASEMASFINKRAKVTSEAVTGDGDLVADGRNDIAKVKDEDLPDNLRAMKPEARGAEIDKQIIQRKALNEKLAALVTKRDKYVAEHRKSAPKASSFDRVVEDTLKAQIKR
ncbi:vWA domain-containing protein [Bradyrhizobium acaciae]|uniref:vWA domain-containing protein n=1 Tax=Bradyrhizobium acaciae TaxID=2683706 RepID=UPI001E29AC0D|nr:vWA domain-containing protein [Bradyrhizobium acaciae]MCC8982412.1 VWA domain-containing protein [Bradyrhizobium acaciae]